MTTGLLGKNIHKHPNEYKLIENKKRINKQFEYEQLKLSLYFISEHSGTFTLLIPGHDVKRNFDVFISHRRPFFAFHVYHYLFDKNIEFAAYADEIEDILKRIANKIGV